MDPNGKSDEDGLKPDTMIDGDGEDGDAMDPSSDDDEVRDGEGSMLKTFPAPLPVLSMATPLSRSIHALALRRDLISDIFVSNGLLISFVHVDILVSARRLFDEMLSRDIVSWNAMLFGYSQGDHYENCLQLYRDMEACPDGFLPNAVIVLSVLQACFQLVNPTFGLEVHRFVVENNVKMNRTGWNSIICFYTKCGCLDFAYQVFDEMGDRDGVTSKGMILSGGQKQRIQLSIAVYNNSDVCSLDDPFSAVDAHTGAHLFKECLMTLLSSRTVSHQLEFLAVRRFFLPPEDKAVLGFSEWVAAAFRKASIGNAVSHVAEGRANALHKVNLSSLQSQLGSLAANSSLHWCFNNFSKVCIYVQTTA
ncbi:putative pentatricopeptide repeat-containing protein At3g49142 [Zingiber officinale]|uniref:putative pentatricopeptide repeat-containing protein At3g49142 n=1 Tax=Zingiber officinale TaxID=94328 RepID=UPI001C4D7DB1|nr:putative pentatricopeptide repeat-containing protein At3g49142 [Zingiber officinale]